MKKIVAMLLAVAGTLGLWADHMSGNDFHQPEFEVGSEFVTGHDDTNGVSDTSFWFTKDTDDFEGTIASDDEGATKYLDFESNITNPVYRTIFNSKSATDTDSLTTTNIGLALFVDTQVKFTPYTVTDVHTAPEGNAGDKLIVWLREQEVETAPGVTNMVTNLVATASYFKDDQNTREVKHYELNYSGSYAALVNSFNRLTIKALVMKEDGESVFVGFVVYLNENVLTYDDNAGIDGSVMTTLSGTAAKYYNSDRHALLPSLAAPLAANAKIAAVGFSGTGAVKQNYFDNYGTDYPEFAADMVEFQVQWSEGVASFSCLGKDIVTDGTAGSTNLTVLPSASTFEISNVTYANGYYGQANTWYDQKKNKINNTTTGATVTINGSAWYMIDAFQDNFDVGGTKFKYLMPTDWDPAGGAYNYLKSNGGTLKLLNNATIGSVMTFTSEDQPVIIDLAGKTLQNTTGESTIFNNGGTLVITNSTVEIGQLLNAETYALTVYGGSTKIYGGIIEAVNDSDGDGFEIYGGTFTGNTTAGEGGAMFGLADYVADGYTYRKGEGNSFTVYPARTASISWGETISSVVVTTNGATVVDYEKGAAIEDLVKGDVVTAAVTTVSGDPYVGVTNWTIGDVNLSVVLGGELPTLKVVYLTDADTTNSTEDVVWGNSPASIPDMTNAKEYYTFTGWDSNPTGAVIKVDTTYTAQWTPITYTISTNGGANATVVVDPADGKGIYGATVAITATPKSGFTYAGVTLGEGWGLNNDGAATNTVTIAGDDTVTIPDAVAEAPTGFTITIAAGEGVSGLQYSIDDGSSWTAYGDPLTAVAAGTVVMAKGTCAPGYYAENQLTVSEDATLTVNAATIMSKYFPTIAGEEEGTEALPFKIENYNDLVSLQAAVTNGAHTAGVYFEQKADIDFAGKAAWAGIGVAKKDPRFCGTYDGKGFKILNVTLDGSVGYAALFGQIGAGADVKNISELNIAGVGNYKDDTCVGGLIGYAEGAVTVSDVKVTGTIGTTAQPMKDNVSGLICRADTDGAAVFTRLEFAGTIYAESKQYQRKVAGILGYSANQSGKTGTITLDSCVFSGSITNNASVDFTYASGPQGGVGGLMGYLWSGCGAVTVKDCVVTGIVTANANASFGAGIIAASLGASTTTQGTNKIAKTSFNGLKLNGKGNSWPESYGVEDATDSSLIDLCGATFTAGKTYYTVKSGLTPTYTFTEAGTISFNTNLYAATAFSVSGGDDFDVAETAAGGVVTFTATAKPAGPTPTQPVELPQGTSQADAEKAAAAATPVIPEGPAKTAGQDNVVKCVAVYNSTKECYQIEVAIDTNKLTKTVQETVVKVAESLPALAAAEAGTVTVPVATEVTPGLYYSLGVATELGSSATFTEGTRVLATGSSISLTVTKPAGTKAFFKVFVNLTAE